ncbi:MAG: imidazolonepropionase [Terricaulis sp.]
MWDTLWLGAHLATMTQGKPYGAIRDGAIGVKDGMIAWIGPRADLPGAPPDLALRTHAWYAGEWITPGLIDCHTHLVFAGNRAAEFEQRLNGASYEDIARAGGGIASTVAATRAATLHDLASGAERRLEGFKADGVTSIEIKSGYGLNLDTERRMLQAARELAARQHIRVRTTFLGLHALPTEYRDDRRAYVDLVCNEMLPVLAREGLIDAVDAFCETLGFSADEVARFFDAAHALGLPVKLHAEQLSNQGGAALASSHRALSADHLEWLDDAGIEAMARAGTVAVLLPGAFYFLRETKLPPIEKLRAAGVAMAVATDCNPGTSPLTSPLLALSMACTLFRLTPEEALAGMTRNAAKALGLANEIGTLEVGKAADFAVWDVREPAELAYWLGAAPLRERVFAGKVAA